jgi:hypothetical protein
MRTYLLAAVFLVGCGTVKKNEQVDADTPDIDAPVTACPAGTTELCMSNTHLTCDAQGNMLTTETCSLGCNTGQPRCNKLSPSNNLSMAFDEAEQAPDLLMMGGATIDTDTGMIVDQSGNRTPPTSTLTTGLPVGVFVIKAKNVTLNNVQVTGTKALAIVASGTITIAGTLSVSARRDISGPGSLDNACRAGSASAGNANGNAGGGGGGFGTAGGRGGTGGSPVVQGGTAGPVVGNVELVPLRGGCPGGHPGGNVQDADPAAPDPGGGGGAIQLVAGVEIKVMAGGAISAQGGQGKSNDSPIFCIVDTPCGNGEGAGSGGAILLETPKLTVEATGVIAANGGGGSCGVFGQGQPGQSSETPAMGQSCGGDTGNGGAGAAGNVAALNGGNGLNDDPVGGGGGGGAGRIRVNLPLSQTFTPAGIVSPANTVGVLQTR